MLPLFVCGVQTGAVEESKAELSRVQEVAATTGEELKEAKGRVTALIGERDNLSAALREKTEALSHKIKEYSNGVEVVERLQLQIKSLTASQERYTAQIDMYRARVAELERSVHSLEGERMSLADVMNQADANLQHQMRTQAAAKDAEISRLRTEVRELEGQLSESNDTMLDLKADAASAHMQCDGMSSELVSVKQAQADSTRVVATLRAEVQAVRQAATAAEAAYSSRAGELAVAQSRIESLRAQLAASGEECERQRARLDKLEKIKLTDAAVKRIRIVKEEHARFKVELKQMHATCAQLQAQLSAAASLSSAGSESSKELASQLVRCQAESTRAALESANVRSQLEAELEEARAACEETRAALGELRDALARQTASIAPIHEELERLQDAHGDMAAAAVELATAVGAAASLSGEEVSGASSDACGVMRVARAQLAALTPRFSELQLKVGALEAEAAAHEEGTREDIESLQGELSDALRRVDEAENNASDMESQLAEATTLNEEMRARIQELEYQVQVASDKVAGLERHHAEMTQRMGASQRGLEAAKAEHQKQISFLENENVQLMMELRTLRSGVGALSGASASCARTSTIVGRTSVAPSSRPGMRPSVIAGRTSVYAGSSGGDGAARAAGSRPALAALHVPAAVSNVDPDLLAVFASSNIPTSASTPTSSAVPPAAPIAAGAAYSFSDSASGLGRESRLEVENVPALPSKMAGLSSSQLGASTALAAPSTSSAEEAPGDCVQQ